MGVAAQARLATIEARRFGLGSWSDALRLLAESGPTELIAQVRAIERTDSRCERWPRGKAQDDASALYVRI